MDNLEETIDKLTEYVVDLEKRLYEYLVDDNLVEATDLEEI